MTPNRTPDVLSTFRAATAGTAWKIVAGELVVEGVDIDAERTLLALGGGSKMLLKLVAMVSDLVREIGPAQFAEGLDVLPLIEAAASIVGTPRAGLPADMHPLTVGLLLDSRSAAVAALVAAHPCTSPRDLERLAKVWSPSHESTGALRNSTIEGLQVLIAVAANRRTPPVVLDRLSRVDQPEVRLATASNLSTPRPALRRLALSPGGPSAVSSMAATTLDAINAEAEEPAQSG